MPVFKKFNWNKYMVAKMFFIFAATSILFIHPAANVLAQNLEYDIIWLGKVGKLSINKSINAGEISIETKSEVKIPFYTFHWITATTTGKEGKLKSSDYSQLLNGGKREFTEIRQISDNSWQITNEKGAGANLSINHPFYVSKLYFEEPKNISYVFSERFGEPLILENHGEGHYRLLLPEKNYCDYYYEDGICKIVKAKNGSRTIKMVLVDPEDKKG